MAGLKHIDVQQGQVDQACGEIRRMRPDEVEKTLDFVSAVVAARGPERADLGKAERLLKHRNTWSFNEGERARLLDELAGMRRGGRP